MSSSYEDSPCALAGALARLHVQALQTRLAPHRSTAAQFPVLQCLWQRDGQTQSELCHSLSVEQPTLANTLNRMVRDQLVRKIKDTNDRRQVIIRLTKRGRELESVLTGSVEEVLSAAEEGLAPAEIALFRKITCRMIENLRQELEQPPVVLEEVMTEPAASPSAIEPGIPVMAAPAIASEPHDTVPGPPNAIEAETEPVVDLAEIATIINIAGKPVPANAEAFDDADPTAATHGDVPLSAASEPRAPDEAEDAADVLLLREALTEPVDVPMNVSVDAPTATDSNDPSEKLEHPVSASSGSAPVATAESASGAPAQGPSAPSPVTEAPPADDDDGVLVLDEAYVVKP